ncbi:MAG TPA: TetR/AcrR family transcriptional regulator [Chromatiaceae bacterium]|nr:TetR/AcrR family transcriptional regulator [Chromatiaceae bacterium]
MARRNDHSRDEIREMALAAAEKLVSAQGAKGLSARKVAAAIGYTVGTLYLVFDNLDDLILQINARTLDRLHDRMLEELARHKDPMERLLQLGHTYISFADEETHHWELVFEHRLPEGQQPPEWFREKVARMFSLVETSLEPLATTRSPDEIKQAAAALWSGVHGICILAISKQLDVAGVDSVQDLTHSLMSNYLRGFVGSNR